MKDNSITCSHGKGLACRICYDQKFGLDYKQPPTHKEIADKKRVSRPCNAHDLFSIREGLQCGNCLAYTRDGGKTWKEPKE